MSTIIYLYSIIIKKCYNYYIIVEPKWGDTIIKIIEIKSRIPNGCTNPYIAWCDDGNTYVVKLPGNPEGKKALINEFVASKLCDILELPNLKYNLISVSANNYNSNMNEYVECIDGTAFGTVYDDNLLLVLNPKQIFEVINNNDAIKIIIFDLLIGNNDRNKGNLMIDSVTKKLTIIDHSHIFELETLWDAVQLERITNEKFDVSKLNQYNYNNLIESVNYSQEMYKELYDFVNKIKKVKKEQIIGIIDLIPADWNITNEEKNALVNYIYNRFQRIDEILEILNIKGGVINEF